MRTGECHRQIQSPSRPLLRRQGQPMEDRRADRLRRFPARRPPADRSISGAGQCGTDVRESGPAEAERDGGDAAASRGVQVSALQARCGLDRSRRSHPGLSEVVVPIQLFYMQCFFVQK